MKRYFEETKTINTLPSRAYFIPFSVNDEKSYNREDSSRFISLNGTWKIEGYESFSDAEDFYKNEENKEIPVPSCVQYYGYDYMQYTNIRYPFPYDPPYVPMKNPCFHYSRYFDYDKKENAYLVFEGVDSCFYVYVNGNFVGYSYISHRISEFDITPYVKEKNNKLDVLVVKWNKGSYFEDQDKWRLTGIFRDVYLLSRPEKHITDYLVTTKMDGTVSFKNKSSIDINVSFDDKKKTVPPDEVVEFKVENPKLWSAEIPYLYDMELEANGEIIYQRVGICESEVRNGIYLFNGKPIKLRGVNRHDFHPEKGFAVSYEDMKKDILLMKSLNVNALRTSHYPSSPLLYELCNELGIYVMSESDLESHGCQSCGEPGLDYYQGMCIIGSDEQFLETILDRQISNYEEHKNFSCVNIYSIGNESGWGENFEKALALWKTLTTKPIHYESLWLYGMTGKWDEYYETPIDCVSRMYPETEWMIDGYLNEEREKRPLVLCEYMHSMGNPGGMKEYWDIMESSDRFMGAYVWEWADHGVRYKTKYQNYGGDYGEFMHDGLFCIDGIVSTDREVRSATLQMKYAYQPLSFEYDNGILKVFNKNYFKEEKGTLIVNDIALDIEISPRSYKEYEFGGNIIIKYIVNGYEAAKAQFITEISNPKKYEYVTPLFKESGHKIIATIPNGEFVFDKDLGEIIEGRINGETIGKISLNIWRAPTDNDRNIVLKWKEHYLDHAKCEARSFEVKNGKLIFDSIIFVPCYYPLVRLKLIYSFTENGVTIDTDYSVTDKEFYEFIPRIGLYIKLDKTYSKLKYNAYGPEESYSDTYLHTIKKEYESDVKNEYHHYVNPQESGSHYLPEYACLSNGKHTITATGMESFSAIPYSINELDKAKHDEELPISSATYLSLDYSMSGMGTNACGPLPLEKYRVPFKGNGSITIEIK